jgi:hypothetical protein
LTQQQQIGEKQMLPQLTLGYLIILAISFGITMLELVPLAGQIILASIAAIFIGLIVQASKR